MAAKKVDPQKVRDARAKKILFVLVPLLVLIGAWQGPKMLKQLRGEASAAAPAATTDPAVADDGTTATPETDPGATEATAPATDTAVPPAPAGSETGAAVVATADLSDTDAAPPADEGQLLTFSRFEARDPFVQLIDDGSDEAGATSDSSGTAPGTSPGSGSIDSTGGTYTGTAPTVGVIPGAPGGTVGGTTGGEPTGTPAGAPTAVRLSVNGKVHVLVVGDTFPTDDPAFKLVSIAGDSVQIGLVSGAFAEGIDTLTLSLGQPLTLISQPDGARFTLKLLGPV
jgi:hypothetical protein